jgi:alkaline phosphatase
MRNIILLFLLISSISASFAQNYSLQQCHAHNDYVHEKPFFEAYSLGYGSIEVDLFLVENQLYVAHDLDKVDTSKTFKKLYLNPILTEIEKNNGKLQQPLQLLIDLKTGNNTLKVLESQLVAYKEILKKAKVAIVISGESTDPSNFTNFDQIIAFDGQPEIEYTKSQLKRIALFSASFKDLVSWNGKSQLGDDQLEIVENFVKKIHKKGKKLRFWASPDTPTAWTTLMNLKVDFIGTDNLKGLAKFLE